MDYKNAKQKLSELRDSLDEVLGSKSEGPSREDAEEALKAAKDGTKRAKKTLLGKIKDLPVVDKIAQLGTAGTVAVSTAAVTQTNIAVDETEVFVASVANDVVHERLKFPPVINSFVDFSALDSWGREVMQEKVAEVKAEAAKVEAKVAPVEAKETKKESQPAEETKNEEPQAQEESADNTEEDGGSAEETKQDTEEVESEEVEEPQAEETAEPVPEESVDEIDEIKPHSDLEINEPEQPSILPDDSRVVSPAGPRQV
jgi:outer membrane biosynthesis protein TonB